MDDILTLLDGLRDNRLDYVMARSECNSVTEALKRAGIGKTTFYEWDESERQHLDDIAQRMKRETAAQAKMILRGAAKKAAEIKVAGLDSKDKRIQQGVATEILDRIVGKPTNPVELTGAEGGEVVLKVVYDKKPDA